MNSLSAKLVEYRETQAGRYEALDLLSDADLAFALPGNPTVGVLFRQEGEFEQSYIDSFKRMRQDFLYRHDDPSVETSVEALRVWLKSLDAALEKAILGMTEEEIQTRLIDRGGWTILPKEQLQLYVETLLIFYGKLSVYLRALNKSLPEAWMTWIG